MIIHRVLRFTLFLFLGLLTIQAQALVKPLPIGEHQCQIEVVLLEDFNGEPNMEELFNKTFGGQNTMTIQRIHNGIRYGTLANKNAADDLQILVMWNYIKDIWTFVGASLVGPVKGYINCQ